jgi:hypothetical protein
VTYERRPARRRALRLRPRGSADGRRDAAARSAAILLGIVVGQPVDRYALSPMTPGASPEGA